MNQPIFDALENCLAQLFKTASRNVYIAYSGGVDSHVLLYGCHQVQSRYPEIRFRALHINHGISEYSLQWEKHCVKTCEKLGIPIQTEQLNLEKAPRQSLEAVAREERYAAISRLVSEGIVLLGQHQDDQAETLLLQLKRGAGPKGLSSMSFKSQSSRVTYYRPFLDVPKKEVLAFAKSQNLEWVEDDSNSDTSIDRNFLREEVLPQLEARWPGFKKAVSRTANLCAEEHNLLQEEVELRFKRLVAGHGSLNLDLLKEESQEWQRQILRHWINLTGLRLPSFDIINEILNSVIPAKQDANPILQINDWQCRRYKEHLYLIPSLLSPDDVQIPWEGQETLRLPNGCGELRFSQSKSYEQEAIILPMAGNVHSVLEIRFSGFNNRFKPEGSEFSKPLNQWFKEWRIPPWERERTPLIFVNNQLAAVAGKSVNQIWVNEILTGTLEPKFLQIRWQQPETTSR